MSKSIKLVAESLQEWEKSEQLNESALGKWEALNKDDEQAVRKFANNYVLKRVSGNSLTILNNNIAKAPIDQLKKELEKGAKDGFKGNWAGATAVYKPVGQVKLQNVSSAGHSFGNAA